MQMNVVDAVPAARPAVATDRVVDVAVVRVEQIEHVDEHFHRFENLKESGS